MKDIFPETRKGGILQILFGLLLILISLVAFRAAFRMIKEHKS